MKSLSCRDMWKHRVSFLGSSWKTFLRLGESEKIIPRTRQDDHDHPSAAVKSRTLYCGVLLVYYTYKQSGIQGRMAACDTQWGEGLVEATKKQVIAQCREKNVKPGWEIFILLIKVCEGLIFHDYVLIIRKTAHRICFCLKFCCCINITCICALWLVALKVCCFQAQQAMSDAPHVMHKHSL